MTVARKIERLDLIPTQNLLDRLNQVMSNLVAILGDDSPAHKRLIEVRIEQQRLRSLYDNAPIGEVEAFCAKHIPTLDVLDAIYDCSNPRCPRVGFKNLTDKEKHYAMWVAGRKIPEGGRRG